MMQVQVSTHVQSKPKEFPLAKCNAELTDKLLKNQNSFILHDVRAKPSIKYASSRAGHVTGKSGSSDRHWTIDIEWSGEAFRTRVDHDRMVLEPLRTNLGAP